MTFDLEVPLLVTLTLFCFLAVWQLHTQDGARAAGVAVSVHSHKSEMVLEDDAGPRVRCSDSTALGGVAPGTKILHRAHPSVGLTNSTVT